MQPLGTEVQLAESDCIILLTQTVWIDLVWLPVSKKIIWVWVNTYRYIFNGMNIHLPAILGFTRYQGFDS